MNAAQSKPAAAASTTRVPVWVRPRSLGFHEALRGLGGIVAPLLAGFSLAAIATLATADSPPPLADWALAVFAITVALLLFSMQIAFMSLTRNSTPPDVLTWRPEIVVSEDELQQARAAQAEAFADMTRLGQHSLLTYNFGLIAFLTAILLLMIPEDWSIGYVVGVAATGIALTLEIWWMAANHWRSLPHPVAKKIEHPHAAGWTGEPPRLDTIGYASIMDIERRKAAGLPPLP